MIPSPAFKLALESASGYLNIKIVGQGQRTWKAKFTSGVIQVTPLQLPAKKETVKGEWLFVPSDGKRGGAKRVNRCFPYIPEWSGDVEFRVLDESITQKIFTETLSAAGQFIGVGRFRPERGGFYGRFIVNNVEWIQV